MVQKKRIQLGLVDDHQIVIDGLMAVLHEQPEIEIVLTANSGEALLEKLKTHTIDILLSDVMMNGMNGKELAKLVKQQYPAIKIIALSMNGQGEIVDEMINDSDISGYLLKQTGKAELTEAIIKVYNGGQYFQEQILAALDKYIGLRKEVEVTSLTYRETEVVKLMEKDFSNKQIADTLDISIRTVETHRKNIFRKTKTNNLLTLVKWAYEHKILG